MLEFQRRQSELYVKQFTLIVFIFTQVNNRPTISFYNLVVPFIYQLKSMGILQPSMLFLFIYWLTDYQQGATHASKISHENNK